LEINFQFRGKPQSIQPFGGANKKSRNLRDFLFLVVIYVQYNFNASVL